MGDIDGPTQYPTRFSAGEIRLSVSVDRGWMFGRVGPPANDEMGSWEVIRTPATLETAPDTTSIVQGVDDARLSGLSVCGRADTRRGDVGPIQVSTCFRARVSANLPVKHPRASTSTVSSIPTITSKPVEVIEGCDRSGSTL
jgi:hypothetical protein